MYKEQMPQEVQERLKRGDAITILDVRELDEWVSGHIPGATHIPLGQINRAMNELDLSKETIVVCRSGNRSGMACEFLSSLGHKAINMRGGMLARQGDIQYGK